MSLCKTKRNRRRERRQKPELDLICPPHLKDLRDRCLASIKAFKTEGEVAATTGGITVYKDRNASVLAVAHLDVVQPGPRHFGIFPGQPDVIYNAQLDDRLGAWIILDLLPRMGIEVDVLLTEGEEKCQSTASEFWPNKEYNWLIEFDRAGTDVVMYNYDTPDLRALLAKQGSKVGCGSYSDIAELEHVGVAGFNWGIGYYQNHSAGAYFRMSEMVSAVVRFREFYRANKNTKLEHIPDPVGIGYHKRGRFYTPYSWSRDAFDYSDREFYETTPEEIQKEIAFKDDFLDYYHYDD